MEATRRRPCEIPILPAGPVQGRGREVAVCGSTLQRAAPASNGIIDIWSDRRRARRAVCRNFTRAMLHNDARAENSRIGARAGIEESRAAGSPV